MDCDIAEHEVPLGILKGIGFSISNDTDREKMAIFEVKASSEVTDSKLGLPNPESLCHTCGSRDRRNCEGHFGVINFEYSIIHPYFIPEIVKLLNKVCPGCKYIRQERSKSSDSEPRVPRMLCRYCRPNTWYPRVRFRVSTKDLFRKSAIIVEVGEKSLERLRLRGKTSLPHDYWDFLPNDTNIGESCLRSSCRILTHAQVYSLIHGIDPSFIAKFIPMLKGLHLTSFLVTPNGHRVSELVHSFSGSRLVFDERTRIYKKLIDFKGHGLELSSRVVECLQYSKLISEAASPSQESANPYAKKPDTPKLCGLRFMKDVLLGKRSDHTFRTVVVGDPSVRLDEIGIPFRIAERLLVSENLNGLNWERLVDACDLGLLERGEVYIRRGENLITIRGIDELRAGDIVFRPLMNGDIVLMNRPPSIHQHSLIAMHARLLPTTSVVSLNPICCHPFSGDFDGDCLHGYVPQSMEARVELNELVALDKQLVNGQNGRNLLLLGQDSLTAAYLVNVEKSRCLKHCEIQQLQMYCPFEPPPPAIIRSSSSSSFDEPRWTGMQLFGMLFPPGFDYEIPSDNVVVRDGDLLSSSEGSGWLRDVEGNFIQKLIRYDGRRVLDVVYSAQEMLSEWLSTRGLSVSLSDLYLSSGPESRGNMMEEIAHGLREAEQVCNFRQLLVNSQLELLAGNDDDLVIDEDKFCRDRQRSAKLSQVSADAFKDVFRGIQTLAYRYGSSDNSFLIMSKAGSKGNIGKLVQHSMCLGLQHSTVPLSFGFPRELSCAAWNDRSSPLGSKGVDASAGLAKSFIPFGVIESSFLSGLNPLEAFAHSVTSRDSSFSGNADLPGTLSRRLMFFMRDIYASYDGTVRNSYGDLLVQFSYETEDSEVTAGEPVGSLSACAISEAAYSALDQPVSRLETSPLLNLKNVLECGSKKGLREQTMSLYLSESLGTSKYGFEYRSLEVKNHLEKVALSDIVSTVTIMYTPQVDKTTPLSPWVCHFHVSKKIAKQKLLNAESVVHALYKQYMTRQNKFKLEIANLKIRTNNCSDTNETEGDRFCVTVTVVEVSRKASTDLSDISDVLIPFLLDSVVKGFREVKKVDILWRERPKTPKTKGYPSGELFLKVTMSGDGGKTNFWSKLLDSCVQIMEMIDWSRSHPDNIHQCSSAFGIGVGWKIFLANLESAITDTGKTILPQHLVLAADSLSVTGEFVGLNAKGWAKQRQIASAPSPFTQACFSSPSDCFVKAAKEGVKDGLQGSIDALSWGKALSFGTGDQFDIVYSEKNHGFTKPVDVYDLLSSTATLPKTRSTHAPIAVPKPNKSGLQQFYSLETAIPKTIKTLNGKGVSKSYLRNKFTWNDIVKLSRTLKNILGKYKIDDQLSEADQKTLMIALYFHPNRNEKVGPGAQEIKVGYSSEHENARCFKMVRTDGTTEDFSYHKCVLGALEIIAPTKVNLYKSKIAAKHSGTINSKP